MYYQHLIRYEGAISCLPTTSDTRSVLARARGRRATVSAMSSVAERSGESHSVVMRCLTIECKNYNREWRMWLTKLQPGLISEPVVLCDVCHRKPAVIKGCSEGHHAD